MDQQMIREKLTKRLNEELEVPSVDELKIKICSAHYMFNTINNNGDLVMFFDMRSMYSILRGHIDYNHNQDTNILLPCDYLLEKDLKIKDINTWLPDLVNMDTRIKEYNIMNEQKLKAFKAVKRKYVFIIAAQHHNIDHYKIEKIFRPKYGQGVLALDK